MQYFFMTASSSLKTDYGWWKSTGDSAQKIFDDDDLPKIGIESHPKFDDWLDKDSANFSLLLARTKDSGLFLAIFNLKTDRKDYQQRTIYNSVIFVSETSEDKEKIRLLSAGALDKNLLEKLSAKLNEVLTEKPGKGDNWLFFDESKWRDLLKDEDFLHQNSFRECEVDKGFHLSRDIQDRRDEVRSCLLDKNVDFPEKEILIAITGFKDSDLYKKNSKSIWLVLTKLEVSEQWEKDQNMTLSVRKFLQMGADLLRVGKQNIRTLSLILTIFVFVLVQMVIPENQNSLNKNEDNHASVRTVETSLESEVGSDDSEVASDDLVSGSDDSEVASDDLVSGSDDSEVANKNAESTIGITCLKSTFAFMGRLFNSDSIGLSENEKEYADEVMQKHFITANQEAKKEAKKDLLRNEKPENISRSLEKCLGQSKSYPHRFVFFEIQFDAAHIEDYNGEKYSILKEILNKCFRL